MGVGEVFNNATFTNFGQHARVLIFGTIKLP
jgi:hypothetical protein